MNSNNYEKHDYEFQVIKGYHMFPVKDINFDIAGYQRDIEPARLKNIMNSIEKTGYWPQLAITLNHIFKPVDGRHRAFASKKLGYEEIPAVIFKFETLQDEARYFEVYNGFNTSLSPVDFWHARYKAEHPIAVLLYKLEQDEDCLFYNRIALKYHETKMSKYTITKAFSIIFLSLGLSIFKWNSREDERIIKSVINTDYNIIKDNVNTHVNIIEKSFGSEIKNNRAYSAMGLRALCQFINYLKRYNKLESNNDIEKLIFKMQSFHFSGEFLRTDNNGKISWFISHYNKGLKNKLEIR